MSLQAQITFLFVVFGAYFTGTVMGFGTSILCITFAAQLMPLDRLLPIIGPLNLALSLYIALRYRKFTSWRYLLWRVVPLVGAGVPLGLLLFSLRDVAGLRLAFGVFVVILASLQLRMELRGQDQPVEIPRRKRVPLLVSGGILHGLFTTGGPLVVYVLGRELTDKTVFRSTIATLFIPMTGAILVDYAYLGLFDPGTAKQTAMALPAYLLGLWLGEIAHRKVENQRFKRLLWMLLLVGGVILTVRGALRFA